MKKIVVLFAIICSIVVGCQKFDPTDLWNNINSLDKRVTELEKLCKQLNTNITALQTLVDAVSKQDYITNISPIQYEGKVIGYTITFAKSSPITIYHGKDGVNGQDGQDGKPGQDGQTPVISVRKDVDGIYYWTLNGEWLLDDAGQKVKAEGKDGANGQDGQNGNDGAAGQDGNDGAAGKDGVTPQLKIENGMWYVSYNNGQTWVEVGPATGSEGPQGPTGPQGPQGPAGDSMFSKVDYDEKYLYLTLADGTQINVPRTSSNQNDLSGLLNVNPLEITDNSVTITGKLNILPKDLPYAKIDLYLSKAEPFNIFDAERFTTTSFDSQHNFKFVIKLIPSVRYSYCFSVTIGSEVRYGKVQTLQIGDISLYKDLSKAGTANCYLISASGKYKFPAVRGNSTITIGNVESVEILWESFGTDVMPNVGDLVTNASYSNGYICFETSATFKQGNAVIAAKNSKGTILWSWHIWCSSEGWKEQVYFNNAGTMMDRNLGATTAQPNTVGALGLLYQWGRKDPFMGSASINSNVDAVSTGTWTYDVNISSITPNMAEVNPMTYYCNLSLPDSSWSSQKTAYDPCPAGWRVPDGGDNGTWAKASGSSFMFSDHSLWNGSGMNFSGKFGSDSMISYPASGYRNFNDGGALYNVGYFGFCWSCSPYRYIDNACDLFFNDYGGVYPSHYGCCSYAYSVRCLKE